MGCNVEKEELSELLIGAGETLSDDQTNPSDDYMLDDEYYRDSLPVLGMADIDLNSGGEVTVSLVDDLGESMEVIDEVVISEAGEFSVELEEFYHGQNILFEVTPQGDDDSLRAIFHAPEEVVKEVGIISVDENSQVITDIALDLNREEGMPLQEALERANEIIHEQNSIDDEWVNPEEDLYWEEDFMQDKFGYVDEKEDYHSTAICDCLDNTQDQYRHHRGKTGPNGRDFYSIPVNSNHVHPRPMVIELGMTLMI